MKEAKPQAALTFQSQYFLVMPFTDISFFFITNGFINQSNKEARGQSENPK